jgi:hypothetical protein
MDVACVVGVKVPVVTMENNNRAVEHIVGACCRGGEIPVEDAAFRAGSDEDRVMAIGRHTNAGKALTRDLGDWRERRDVRWTSFTPDRERSILLHKLPIGGKVDYSSPH